MNLGTKNKYAMNTKINDDLIEYCDLYCERESKVDGVPNEFYFIKVMFTWKNVSLINQCDDDSTLTIIKTKFDERLAVKLDFEYCMMMYKKANTLNILNYN